MRTYPLFNKTSAVLRNCPVCNSHNLEFIAEVTPKGERSNYQVRCVTCNYSGVSSDDQRIATTYWNRIEPS